MSVVSIATWDELPPIVTVAEAAEFLRTTKAGVYGAIKLGILPAMNVGKRRTRIAKAALQKIFGVIVESPRQTAAFGRVSEANL